MRLTLAALTAAILPAQAGLQVGPYVSFTPTSLHIVDSDELEIRGVAYERPPDPGSYWLSGAGWWFTYQETPTSFVQLAKMRTVGGAPALITRVPIAIPGRRVTRDLHVEADGTDTGVWVLMQDWNNYSNLITYVEDHHGTTWLGPLQIYSQHRQPRGYSGAGPGEFLAKHAYGTAPAAVWPLHNPSATSPHATFAGTRHLAIIPGVGFWTVVGNATIGLWDDGSPGLPAARWDARIELDPSRGEIVGLDSYDDPTHGWLLVALQWDRNTRTAHASKWRTESLVGSGCGGVIAHGPIAVAPELRADYEGTGTSASLMLALGPGTPSVPGFPPGCQIHLDPASSVSLPWQPTMAGELAVQLPLPNAPSIHGVTLFAQFAAFGATMHVTEARQTAIRL